VRPVSKEMGSQVFWRRTKQLVTIVLSVKRKQSPEKEQ
jgi:hypothetical protein